ncbi:exodeoxyribonuclease VII large subunit [Comamonas serinivorans]|uniref:Exodeoxyribonuclease 7 large subunit n=1 Tax=Comamonas serinivorans TaxID=1082851 RepID=A0A1Y0END9_9BURK|nr:exodeoxyribonuclease VII large subunit [Comamonas serinivorans]ARU05106.1 exodeoxyribonuclease VII large subunit [Comamonas serinivorans]
MAEAWGTKPVVWEVGALCKAADQALAMRFGAVSVRGELSGFSRAGSGHCYFTLKDGQGQLRCAMFRRAAQGLGFAPRDGDSVELQGRLGVYEARGDLQLVVERMRPVGQGALYERFLQLKARLQAQGLFDADRKRPLPAMPRGIGLVTSLGAAALHDVLTALRRRAPHVPVWLAPARVQGAEAPASIQAALESLYQAVADADSSQNPAYPQIDVVVLVRGGGSLEDLWAFNDEHLAHAIARSPVPLIAGVGHETDFTIADFVADVRAPTPTAAAELVSASRQALWRELQACQTRLSRALERRVQQQAQRLDGAASRLARPAQWLQGQRLRLAEAQAGLRHGVQRHREREGHRLDQLARRLDQAVRTQASRAEDRLQRLDERLQHGRGRDLERRAEALTRIGLRLSLLDPQHVLDRGYSLLVDEQGQVLSHVAQLRPGTPVRAHVADGHVDLSVTQPRLL